MAAERTERILIAGAGIAGLATALALGSAGREVVLLERDAPPPDLPADELFARWQRPGVTQLRHSHGFFGRLRNLLRDRYPALYGELLAAGARERRFVDGLPPWMLPAYRPLPGDEELTGLYCRRTTFEQVLHRHVTALPAVRLESGVRVDGLLVEERGGGLTVTGTAVAQGAVPGEMPCDVLIDACGRGSAFPEGLRRRGAVVHEESSPTGILYYTRYYRLRPGCDEPDGQGHPRVGDLGYLKFGIFPAERGTFSITLVVPTADPGLAVVRDDEVFERVCRLLPVVALWVERAEPVTAVFSMGGQRSYWRRFVDGGRPAALGYFAVGESAFRANPLYGSGCSLTFLHAHLLAETLLGEADPARRALRFDARARAEIGPHYRSSLRRDRRSLAQVRRGSDPAAPPPRLGERLFAAVMERGIAPAMRRDLRVRRTVFRDMHLLGRPGAALRSPGVLLRVLSTLAARGGDRALAPPDLGPGRAEMRRLVGLDAPGAPPAQTEP